MMVRSIGTAILLILSALPAGARNTAVTYKVPNGYNGFLFLTFNMPGGLIPDREFDFADEKSSWPSTIVIEFDNEGLARYGYEALPDDANVESVVELESGAVLPLVKRKRELGKALPLRALLRGGAKNIYRKGRKAFGVEVFLVGDPAKFPESLVNYRTDEIDRLLLKHFGLPLPEKPAGTEKK